MFERNGRTCSFDERFYKSAESVMVIPTRWWNIRSICIDGWRKNHRFRNCELWNHGIHWLGFSNTRSLRWRGNERTRKIVAGASRCFTLQVPKNTGSVEVQAFQDVLGDGPLLMILLHKSPLTSKQRIFWFGNSTVEGARNDDPNLHRH